MGFPGGSVVKNPPANIGDVRLMPESGRSPGEGNGNPLQYSCLGNPMDKGAWWATVHRVTKRQRGLSDWACRRVYKTVPWKQILDLNTLDEKLEKLRADSLRGTQTWFPKQLGRIRVGRPLIFGELLYHSPFSVSPILLKANTLPHSIFSLMESAHRLKSVTK